ncbi:OmpA family protein [Maribacter sp. MAR_2009_72]|nr:OmpA family protein [Maribacter sp. MAR_2009_72]
MLLNTLNKVIVLLLLFGSTTVLGQNVVVNPSFEKFVQCPVKLGNLAQDVSDWNMPTLGSTDYFNGCSTAMGTPKNFNGQQSADFGKGYVGFYMFAPDNYREYIQGKLFSTLDKGRRYTVTFYISLAERSDFAVKQFGIRFSEFPVSIETSKVLSNMHFSKVEGDTSNKLEIKYSKFFADEVEWVKLSKEFVANGTENFIIIGNFYNDRRTQKYQTKRKLTKGSYYYLDMVSVTPIDSLDRSTPNYELDSVHVFKDVHFNFNKSTFKTEYQQELNGIVQYLKNNPNLKITITGHTDSIGTEIFNKELSLMRAKEVGRFLTVNGIQGDRIHIQGHGSAKPIASNKTKAGRLLNRRVEFILEN